MKLKSDLIDGNNNGNLYELELSYEELDLNVVKNNKIPVYFENLFLNLDLEEYKQIVSDKKKNFVYFTYFKN